MSFQRAGRKRAAKCFGLLFLFLAIAACAHGSTPLGNAAGRGDVARVAHMLTEGGDPNKGDKDGLTPLHQSAVKGQLAVVRLLVGAGADVDQADYDGNTPLIFASDSGHPEVARFLVDQGAGLAFESAVEMTAVQHARKKHHQEVVAILQAALRRRPPPQQEQSRAQEIPAEQISELRLNKSYSPGYNRRIAAVIGINQYANWPKLVGAEPDARRVAAQLKKLDFDAVLELYDKDATRDAILKLLGSELTAQATENDLVVVYFAGHGQTETLPGRARERRGYIVPVDGGVDNVFQTGIAMSDLRGLADRLPAKHIYFAMDSCYSGLGFTRGIGMIKKSTPQYIDKVTRKRAVQMVTAGGEGEEALERDGRGLFTTRLIEALSGEADLNTDGYVTASEIGTYVTPRVTEDSGAKQTPQSGRLGGEGEVVFKLRD